MNNLTLRAKLIVLFVASALGIFVVAFVGARTVNALIQSYDEVTDSNLPIVEALDHLKFIGARLISSANETILDAQLALEETGEEAEATEVIEEYRQDFANYRSLVLERAPADIEFVNAIESAGNALVASAEQVLSLLAESAPIEDIAELREQLEADEESLLEALDNNLEVMHARLEQSELIARETSATAQQVLLIVGAAAFIVVSFVAFQIARTVLPGLAALTETAREIGKGNWSVRSQVNSEDELGQFGTVFNEMTTTMEQQIRETEAARDKAEQSDRVKSAFLASMSHELRTPLNSVINLTRFVVDGDTGDINEQQKELLTDVVGSGKHLLALINDVLDMSKIEAGSLNLFSEDHVQLKALIDSAAATARSLLVGKPVRLHTDIANDLPGVRADKQRILQVLLNVLSNACKFTDEGEIRIHARQDNGEVRISVTDTGAGIAAEDQALVFLPFQQTITGLRQGGGTGLGMPIAKNLIEAHGGRIWLESTLGQGTTFHITIPVQQADLHEVAEMSAVR